MNTRLAPASFLLQGQAQQGGMMLGHAPVGTRELRFNGSLIPFDRERRFLIAFDRDAPNSATLRAVLDDGRMIDQPLAVRPGNWRIEHVDASPTGGVTTEEFKARRAGELARINAARAVNAKSDGWRQHFLWPTHARISGLFGSQRIYRGSPGSYHNGVDIAAAAGTAFVAPADGVVILAAQEPFTLEGRLLIIDHGMGLNSAFLHCSRLNVKEGDVVHQGQMLGAVGASGRATGPHLHWGMKWNAARIDPMLIVGPMQP
ncbi:MAG: M23 family metallopeptidase [Sphingobium sp.]